MKLKIYMTKDVLAGQFMLILTAPNDALLKRQAKSFLSYPKSPLGDNLEDTQIFCCAELETETGVIDGYSSPEFLCNLIDIKHELEDDQRKIAEKVKNESIKDLEVKNEN